MDSEHTHEQLGSKTAHLGKVEISGSLQIPEGTARRLIERYIPESEDGTWPDAIRVEHTIAEGVKYAGVIYRVHDATRGLG